MFETTLDNIFIESCNYNMDKIEFKKVLNVTRRKINEELLCFELENGKEFICTKCHLIPVVRNNEKILLEAQHVLSTDELVEIIN